MKRQRGRNRGGGGGGKQPQNANRAFDSNGPEGVKVRGNAQHVFEKYQQLARDATSSGDRVLAENYLQHAEHYFRLLRAMQPQRPASEILGRDQFASGFDIDFEDEGVQAQAEAADEAAAEAAQQGGGGEEGEQREQRWENRNREGRDRDERPRGERFEGRRDRDDREGGGGGRRDRWRDRDRDERPRAERDGERQRDDRDGGRRDRSDRDDRDNGRRERDPMPVVEPQGSGFAGGDERPSPVLRDAEGGESQAPAFLQARTEPRDGDEGEGRSSGRRRRRPRSFEAGEDTQSPAGGEAEEV